jgi:hypothetical protein
MSRPFIAALFAVALNGCQGAMTMVESDASRKTISCSASYIAVRAPGRYRCEQFDPVSGINGRGGTFQRFNI